jgi:hypothetical protein
MLPDIGFGAFSLQHLGLVTSLVIPFTGDKPLSISFSFGSRSDPFLVAVTILGGGGYLSITADAKDGITAVEFSLEAGGVVSLDLFVASGSAHILIGMGILKQAGKGLVLLAFLRAGGSLSVLGIITVSIEFDLTLTYDSGAGMLCGECSVTVSIDILFFSADVNVTLRRCFSVGSLGGGEDDLDELGPPSDPPQPEFKDLMSEPDWAMYCEAFATV